MRIGTAKPDAGLFYQNLKNDFPIISKFMDRDDPLEKVHIKFCKNILGDHAKALTLRFHHQMAAAYMTQIRTVFCSNNVDLLGREYICFQCILHDNEVMEGTVEKIF